MPATISPIRRSIKSWIAGLNDAHRAAQHDFLRDHVPRVAAVHLRDADHAGFERMDVARDDRLQRIDDMRGERHRVAAEVRHGGVRAACRSRRSRRCRTRPCSGPGRSAIVPTGSSGPVVHAVHGACIGNRSNRPSCTMTRPPPSFSSAGWKMKYAVPSKFFRCAIALAAPSSIVVWPSWPHACILPAMRRRMGDARLSWMCSASRSARRPTASFDAAIAQHADDAGLRRGPCEPRARTTQLVGDERDWSAASSNAVSGWA